MSLMAFVAAAPLVSRGKTVFFHGARRPNDFTLQGGRRVRAPVQMAGPKRSTEADTPRKQFLDRLKPLRNLRLIGRNDAVIMESIATFDGLFFAKVPTGEYANLIDSSINLDMHLLLEGFSGAKFETGISRDASKCTTYIVRLLGNDRTSVILSLFLQWDKTAADVSEERINAWKALKADYAGDSEQFFFEE